MSFWDTIWKSGTPAANGVPAVAGALGPFGAIGASFLPMLFSGMFGHNDPAAQSRQQYLNLMSPDRIAGMGKQLYNNNINGPGFSMASQAANSGSMNLMNNVNRSFAQRGIFHSGVGGIAPALGQSSLGNRMSSLYGDTWNQSQQQAMQLAQMQGNGFAGMPQPLNYTNSLFASGLQSLLPYLMHMQK